MSVSDPDAVFDALVRAFDVRGTGPGLVEIRRRADDAVLMFRLPPQPHVFGVPLPLTDTSRRMDWDAPTADLDDWLESVELWLLEDVENGFVRRARRRLVDDYVELTGPDWPSDDRFCLSDVVGLTDRIGWQRVHLVTEAGLDQNAPVLRREDRTLVAWVTAYENSSSGSPYVGHATVIREAPSVARLKHVEVVEGAPATLILDLVRGATHAAAENGFASVVTELPLDHLGIAGLRPFADGRYRLRHGPSGTPPRTFVSFEPPD